MTDPTFTILLPVVRSPELMPFAVDSVLRQSRADFELFIISDGAPLATVVAAKRAAEQDPRVRVFDFPKGERHGEAHRHAVLEQACGRYVCQIADDDLWFPDHLAEIAVLLDQFEFGNSMHINITGDGNPFLALADLADPAVRAKMASEIFNFFGPTNAGYRLGTYRRLPVGWSPAPRDLPSDLAMWRKFLGLPDIACGTRFVVTALHFPADLRREWSMDRRREEIARYADIIATPSGRDGLCQQAMRAVTREHTARHEYLKALQEAVCEQQKLAAATVEAVHASWSWRVTAPFRQVARLLGKD